MIDDYSAFFRYAGLFLTKGENGGTTFGSASNMQLDVVQHGVLAYATEPTMGFTITNGYIDMPSAGSPLKPEVASHPNMPSCSSLISPMPLL